MRTFDQNVAGIGSLAEPVRRALYLYVCGQPAPVTRDQAADAVGVARHQAKFHLDRLEAEGLLETDYARVSGRTGPGAGRTAKRYRRAAAEIGVCLPDREYELAGALMAEAIAESARTDDPVLEALHRVAAARGRAIGESALGEHPSPATAQAALAIAIGALADHGFEPRSEGQWTVMANCPFHALAQTHTQLVCRMNHALIGGLVDAVAPGRVRASLDPGDDRCCVVLSADGAAGTP